MQPEFSAQEIQPTNLSRPLGYGAFSLLEGRRPASQTQLPQCKAAAEGLRQLVYINVES
jgi:hypothetical protein